MTVLLKKNPVSGVPQEVDVGTVPVGGTTGQVLAKASNTNFDTTWTTPSGSSFDTDTILTGPTSCLYSVAEEPLEVLIDGNGNILVGI